MNVAQLVNIPLRKLVLLSFVYFDILSADSSDDQQSERCK